MTPSRWRRFFDIYRGKHRRPTDRTAWLRPRLSRGLAASPLLTTDEAVEAIRSAEPGVVALVDEDGTVLGWIDDCYEV